MATVCGMAFVDIDGTEFAYDEAGSGEPVVFIHGDLVDRRMWDHQFDALADRYRVVRYDRRGYGRSGDVSGPVSHHEDLLAVMDALGVGRAHLVGSSYGGAYAVEAALAAPDRVASLALWCPGMPGHEWPPEMGDGVRAAIAGRIQVEDLARYAAGSADVDPADVAVMAAAQIDYTFVGPERARDEVDAEALARAEDMCRGVFERTWGGPSHPQRMLEPSVKQRLAKVTQATLVVNGLSDVSYIQQVSALYVNGIVGARRVDMADTGHIPPLERPAESTRILARFLGGIPLVGGRL